jgi:ABC-type phosphate/phosphonate transport system substrate-binding protein
MTAAPLRTAAISTEAERKQAQKDAAATLATQLGAHLKLDLAAHHKKIIEALAQSNADDIFNRGKLHGMDLGEAKARAGRTWTTLAIVFATAGVSILGTLAIMDRTLLTGVAIGRGEAGNEELKRMEQAQ